MLKIRLSRTGKRTQPSFRIVVQEHTAPIKGKFVDVIGHYHPALKSKDFSVDQEKVKHWISKGAKPSPTVANLLKKNGMQGMEKYLTAPNKKGKKKGEEAEKPAQQGGTTPAPKAPEAEKPAEAKAAPAPKAPAAPKAEAPAAPKEPEAPAAAAEPAAAEAVAAEPAPAPTEPTADQPK